MITYLRMSSAWHKTHAAVAGRPGRRAKQGRAVKCRPARPAAPGSWPIVLMSAPILTVLSFPEVQLVVPLASVELARGPADDPVPVGGHPQLQPSVTGIVLRGRPDPRPVRAV